MPRPGTDLVVRPLQDYDASMQGFVCFFDRLRIDCLKTAVFPLLIIKGSVPATPVAQYNRLSVPARITAVANEADKVAPPSIDENLTDLNGDDAHEQVAGAARLSIVPLDDTNRTKVIAALQQHLNSSDHSLRQASVNAFVHWATKGQIPELIKVVATRSTNEAQDGSAGCCAAAVCGLVRLDPDAADQAVRGRMNDFFFRSGATQELLKVAEFEPMYSATAVRLLKLIDVDDQMVNTSVHDAETMLQSDSATIRSNGANSLAIAVIDAKERGNVLNLLKQHLQSPDGRSRLPFVRAFVHWADQTNVSDLQAIIAFPTVVKRNNGNEDCWAAAIAGLVRLNAATEAIDSYNSRADANFMNFAVSRLLDKLARGVGPEQPLAFDLLQQLKTGRSPRLKSSAPNGEATVSRAATRT